VAEQIDQVRELLLESLEASAIARQRVDAIGDRLDVVLISRARPALKLVKEDDRGR
jgi:hypothetical protein